MNEADNFYLFSYVASVKQSLPTSVLHANLLSLAQYNT